MKRQARLLGERSLEIPGARPARSVTFNAAESPLGWLFARGLVTQRQYDAGERLRADWERAQLSPRVTMGGGGVGQCQLPTGAIINAQFPPHHGY